MNKWRALSIHELCEKLCENKRTLIIYHVRSDADAVGSAFALRELLSRMGIPAMCACADEVPERLRFLSEDVQGSVLLEEGIPLDHQRVISVDSASPQQLGDLFSKFHWDIELMIDHHDTGLPYADHYIDPTAAATGEIIYMIAKELMAMEKLPMLYHRAAEAIYAAICSDTGCFRFANVTPRTLRIAAELLEEGVNAPDITRRLYDSKSLKQVKAEGEAARRILVHDGGRIASVTFPYSSKYSLNLSDEHLETIIDIPRSVAGVEVAFSIRQPEQKNFFRVSMRSNSEFDVAAVCAVFGGGGHVRAAGCSIEADSIDDAERMIVKAIKEKRT